MYTRIFPDATYIPTQCMLVFMFVLLSIVILVYDYVQDQKSVYLYLLLLLIIQSLYQVFVISCTIYGHCTIFSWILTILYILGGLIIPVYVVSTQPVSKILS